MVFNYFRISVSYFRKNIFLRFSTGPLNLSTFYVQIFFNELSITSMFTSVFRSQLHCSYREKNSKRFVRTSNYDGTYSFCNGFFK